MEDGGKGEKKEDGRGGEEGEGGDKKLDEEAGGEGAGGEDKGEKEEEGKEKEKKGKRSVASFSKSPVGTISTDNKGSVLLILQWRGSSLPEPPLSTDKTRTKAF